LARYLSEKKRLAASNRIKFQRNRDIIQAVAYFESNDIPREKISSSLLDLKIEQLEWLHEMKQRRKGL
jgi:hypothetical protein